MSAYRYGCHDRRPFAQFYALTGGGLQKNVFAQGENNGICKFTHSPLGRTDPGCQGCRWRAP